MAGRRDFPTGRSLKRRDAQGVEHHGNIASNRHRIQRSVEPKPSLSKLEVARALAVSVGPSLVLNLFAAASTVFPWLYFLAIRPWHRR